MMEDNRRIWVISEVYYPDEAGGAHFMTQLAEGLTQFFDVSVLCGYPSYTHRGDALPVKSIRNKVMLERCYGTFFNRKIFIFRLINILTISVSIFFKTLYKIRRQDIVIVVTTPPLLPFVVLVACILRRTKCILRIDDVYPEALIAAGIINQQSKAASFLSWMNRLLYSNVDRIVVLGRDMKHLIVKKLKKCHDKTIIIQNWADLDVVFPAPKSENFLLQELGLANKFIVQCAGNMGLAQDIETMFKAIGLLKENVNIHFLFIGSGAKRQLMENEVSDKKLSNVTILDQRNRSDQHNFLNACDIAMVSLIYGMKGAGVPSRMYNIMASGKPIIAISEFESELSMVIEEEKVGWSVLPGNFTHLAEVILEAYSNHSTLVEMSGRARAAALTKYSSKLLIDKYYEMIKNMSVNI